MKIYENKYIFIIDRISGACFAGITLMEVMITAIKTCLLVLYQQLYTA